MRAMGHRAKTRTRSPSWPGGARAVGWGEPSIPGYHSHPSPPNPATRPGLWGAGRKELRGRERVWLRRGGG